jgi:hypothetical protein
MFLTNQTLSANHIKVKQYIKTGKLPGKIRRGLISLQFSEGRPLMPAIDYAER